ncbi:MAG: oligosaccharide flippase family protein [Odoribacteraceae bacterium]|jgi:O-antigen/teichoic acid export membrane protein|nr:oligosaccharide flippase family protein [Odoribacteraceae bacterium]
MSLKALAGQTAIYGISSIVARMLNYLLTPYLTRVLTETQYGVVTAMYALIPFAMVVLTMGLETGYFRFAGMARTGEERRAVFSSAWGAVIVAAALFAGVAGIFTPSIAPFLGYGENPSFVWMVGAIIGLDAASSIPFCRLREEGRAGRFVVLKIVSVGINAALCLFFYSVLPALAAAHGGIFARAWEPSFTPGYVFVANLAASAVTFLLLLPSCRGAWPRLSRRVLRPLLVYSAPLLVSGFAGTANEFIDRLMIEYMMPRAVALSTLGVYGAVVKIGVILPLFVQMYRYSLEPYFLSGFRREEFARVNAIAMKYFIIVSLVLFLGITLFADLFALLLGAAFREGMFILPVVLVSNILSGIVFNLSFWYKQANKTRFGITITVTGLLFTIVFGILLVPSMGYIGAAVTRLICELVMVITSYRLNRKHFPVPYDLRRIGEYALLGAGLFGVGIFTVDWPALLKYPCNGLLCAIFCLYAARREKINIISIVTSIIKRR